MAVSRGRHWSADLVTGTLVGAAVVLAVLLRLQDPLSTMVLPGQDPYRHYMLTWRFVDGRGFDDYPPGLHALMATLWIYTGLDLYALFRFAPSVMGGIGVLGMALLLWRNLGRMPALVASLGYAVLPGFIRFTTKLAPTAVDLAVAPFLFYVVLEILRGRLAWGLALVPMAWFFVYLHPWFYLLLAATMCLFLLLCVVFRGTRGSDEPPASAISLTIVLAVFGVTLAIMMTGVIPYTLGLVLLPPPLRSDIAPWIVMGGSVLPLLFALAFPKTASRLLTARPGRTPISVKVLLPLVIGAVLFLVTAYSILQGLPQWVDLPRRFGWPALLMGAIAFFALPFYSRRIGLLAAAYVAITYPLSMVDLYDISWLPYRMSFFFGIGLVILVGVAVKQAMAAAAAFSAWMTRNTEVLRPVPRVAAFGILPLLLGSLFAGAVYVTAPDDRGWYRMHDECEADALREAAGIFDAEPGAHMLTGSWQSQRVLHAFVDRRGDVWEGDWWLESYHDYRYDLLKSQEQKGAPLLVLVDPNTRANASFLEESPWKRHTEWCPDGEGGHTVVLYTTGPMYTRCQMEAFEAAAGLTQSHPGSLTVAGSWQAKTMLDIFLDDPDQAISGDWWIRNPPYRHEAMEAQRAKDAPLYVLVDPYTFDHVPVDDLESLRDAPWQHHADWCPGDGGAPTMRMHQWTG